MKEYMEKSGVDISVVLPVVTKPQQFSSINRYARESLHGRVLRRR